MDRRGFTLIELLAVIIILSGIGVLAVFQINESLEKQEQKELENKKEKAINSAKIYFSLNDSDEVCLSELTSGNYLEEKDVINNSDCVTVNSTGYQYKENCSCS